MISLPAPYHDLRYIFCLMPNGFECLGPASRPVAGSEQQQVGAREMQMMNEPSLLISDFDRIGYMSTVHNCTDIEIL